MATGRPAAAAGMVDMVAAEELVAKAGPTEPQIVAAAAVGAAMQETAATAARVAMEETGEMEGISNSESRVIRSDTRIFTIESCWCHWGDKVARPAAAVPQAWRGSRGRVALGGKGAMAGCFAAMELVVWAAPPGALGPRAVPGATGVQASRDSPGSGFPQRSNS